jgi:hypothetical protein
MNFVKKFNMDLQEKMFEEVEAWRKSGLTKQVFVKDKEYTLAKFNYWVAKQSAMQTSEKIDGFQEVGFLETKLGKVRQSLCACLLA